MQTNFSATALADPNIAASEAVIRKCVHCGFCTATCPTYVLLGDELDSPRGRIYLIKDMLENTRVPTPTMVKHVDRCLSCLSCMTTCPSGVNYMHLVDHARAYIEEQYRRPLQERLLRWILAKLLPYPSRFRAALAVARWLKPTAPLLVHFKSFKPIVAMLDLAPSRLPARRAIALPTPSVHRGRVILLQGCVEPTLRPETRAAAVRILSRAGFVTCFAPTEVCCGALVHHMGRSIEALAAARRNIDLWMAEIARGDVAAILTTASGCGVALKDYGFMLRQDSEYAEKAAVISGLAKDISEFLETIGLPDVSHPRPLRVAYHAACALQHGQQITDQPKRLLEQAGYRVQTPEEAHLCCGSAGVYNILQPELAAAIGARKVERLERLTPQVIATGNIGCATQIGARTSVPVVHTVELLDWATGGPVPPDLSALADKVFPEREQTLGI